MPSRVSRRSFVARLAAGASAAVVGFDPERRSWATEKTGPLVGLPRFDGQLVTDAAVLDEVSQDNGRMVSRRPLAVLRPGSVDDIARMVRWANEHRVKVAMRGQGHSSFGQAQVDAGVVIDSRALRRIGTVGAGTVTVDAGATWEEVLATTLPKGLTPPVLPDTQVLTVGGTLSVGGTGNASHRHGAIVDHVRTLSLVTGRGRMVTCSEKQDRDLFDMALAGLGQVGIITSAELALVPAPVEVVLQDFDYADLDAFLADQRGLALGNDDLHHVGGPTNAHVRVGNGR